MPQPDNLDFREEATSDGVPREATPPTQELSRFLSEISRDLPWVVTLVMKGHPLTSLFPRDSAREPDEIGVAASPVDGEI